MKIITVHMVPPSPNELRRKYRTYHAYRQLRKQWQHDLFYSLCLRHRNELMDHARKAGQMCVAITIYHTKEFDPDNLPGACKPILDALVNLQYLADDSPSKLQFSVSQVIGSEKKTEIKIGPAVAKA
jgi:Holliday junction resolvase RusA-like endonuclease